MANKQCYFLVLDQRPLFVVTSVFVQLHYREMVHTLGTSPPLMKLLWTEGFHRCFIARCYFFVKHECSATYATNFIHKPTQQIKAILKFHCQPPSLSHVWEARQNLRSLSGVTSFYFTITARSGLNLRSETLTRSWKHFLHFSSDVLITLTETGSLSGFFNYNQSIPQRCLCYCYSGSAVPILWRLTDEIA